MHGKHSVADQELLASSFRDVVTPHSYADSSVKRGYDLVLAIGLLLLSAPVLLPAILLNIFFTRGNPIFVQRRAGKKGVEFRLLKLRTMRMQKKGEKWAHRTTEGDERLTPVGGLLRRIYLDELPQLVNVIIGQMSMIGPRPETLETMIEISNAHPDFEQRILVKPGISGAAQVYFRKPESEHDLWRRYYYDRIYIVRCSFWFDLKLSALTVIHVIRNKGQ